MVFTDVEIGIKSLKNPVGSKVSETLNFNIPDGQGKREARMSSGLDDLDDLPSLDEIFSRPNSHKKIKASLEAGEEDKENKESVKVSEPSPREKAIVSLEKRPRLDVNTAVFAMDFYENIYVPGIVIGHDEMIKSGEKNCIHIVKFYTGKEEHLTRKNVHSPDDKEFYSLATISLKKVQSSNSKMIRPFNKKEIVKTIKDGQDNLLKILTGERECKRDIDFLSGIRKRSMMNSENSPGPFTLEEYNFILEYIPNVLLPKFVNENDNLLEKRFEKRGEPLNHFLRQYSYFVLVPEFIVLYILKIDKSVKSYTEANDKFLNDLKAYDDQTGNFINYLYSKKEMYQYAYREKRIVAQEDDLDIYN